MGMKPKATVQGLPVYQPGKTLAEVKEEYGIHDVIKLASNENPFGCSPKVWEALGEMKGDGWLLVVRLLVCGR